MRLFESGATRDNDEGKYDLEGFLSPLVIERYAEYMHKHRVQADGKLRDSDNWQKGIPLKTYFSSFMRHSMDAWFIHRGYRRFDKKDGHEIFMDEALSAILFNISGYLHTILKAKNENKVG